MNVTIDGDRTLPSGYPHAHASEQARRIAEAGLILRVQVESGVGGAAWGEWREGSGVGGVAWGEWGIRGLSGSCAQGAVEELGVA